MFGFFFQGTPAQLAEIAQRFAQGQCLQPGWPQPGTDPGSIRTSPDSGAGPDTAPRTDAEEQAKQVPEHIALDTADFPDIERQFAGLNWAEVGAGLVEGLTDGGELSDEAEVAAGLDGSIMVAQTDIEGEQPFPRDGEALPQQEAQESAAAAEIDAVGQTDSEGEQPFPRGREALPQQEAQESAAVAEIDAVSQTDSEGEQSFPRGRETLPQQEAQESGAVVEIDAVAQKDSEGEQPLPVVLQVLPCPSVRAGLDEEAFLPVPGRRKKRAKKKKKNTGCTEEESFLALAELVEAQGTLARCSQSLKMSPLELQELGKFFLECGVPASAHGFPLLHQIMELARQSDIQGAPATSAATGAEVMAKVEYNPDSEWVAAQVLQRCEPRHSTGVAAHGQ